VGMERTFRWVDILGRVFLFTRKGKDNIVIRLSSDLLLNVSSSCKILPRYKMRRYEGAGGRSSVQSKQKRKKSTNVSNRYQVKASVKWK
jgi:hypothetical protein